MHIYRIILSLFVIAPIVSCNTPNEFAESLDPPLAEATNDNLRINANFSNVLFKADDVIAKLSTIASTIKSYETTIKDADASYGVNPSKYALMAYKAKRYAEEEFSKIVLLNIDALKAEYSILQTEVDNTTDLQVQKFAGYAKTSINNIDALIVKIESLNESVKTQQNKVSRQSIKDVGDILASVTEIAASTKAKEELDAAQQVFQRATQLVGQLETSLVDVKQAIDTVKNVSISIDALKVEASRAGIASEVIAATFSNSLSREQQFAAVQAVANEYKAAKQTALENETILTPAQTQVKNELLSLEAAKTALYEFVSEPNIDQLAEKFEKLKGLTMLRAKATGFWKWGYFDSQLVVIGDTAKAVRSLLLKPEDQNVIPADRTEATDDAWEALKEKILSIEPKFDALKKAYDNNKYVTLTNEVNKYAAEVQKKEDEHIAAVNLINSAVLSLKNNPDITTVLANLKVAMNNTKNDVIDGIFTTGEEKQRAKIVELINKNLPTIQAAYDAAVADLGTATTVRKSRKSALEAADLAAINNKAKVEAALAEASKIAFAEHMNELDRLISAKNDWVTNVKELVLITENFVALLQANVGLKHSKLRAEVPLITTVIANKTGIEMLANLALKSVFIEVVKILKDVLKDGVADSELPKLI